MEDFKKELSKLPKDYIVLILLSKESYEEKKFDIVRKIISENKKIGSYIAVNKPYKSIINSMTQKGIDHKKLLFIDCVTKKEEKSENVIFLKSPSKLTSIGITLESMYPKKEIDFIMIDSIDSLLVYNKKDAVIKFIRSVMERAREHNKKGIIFALENNMEEVIAGELYLVCDKIIKVKEKTV